MFWSITKKTHIGGVMVRVLALSVVDRWAKTDCIEIRITKVVEWSDMSTLLFH